jgi:sialic acid synthase SpsE
MTKNKINIIAEIGINHNGNIKLAKKMIDLAKKAGANFVKFQSYKTKDLLNNKENLMSYQSKNMKRNITQFNMLKRCELSDMDQIYLKKYCKYKLINFLSTPYSIERANFLISIGEKIIKIASTDSTNIQLINHILKKNKKVIISTGATSIKEIDIIMKKINYKKNFNNITLMHCTSYYPACVETLNLDTIKYLKKKYKVKVGFSDHSVSTISGALAVMNGAEIIEKHFTLSKKLWGPDHKASLEYNELKDYISNIKFAYSAKGKYQKILSNKELKIKKQMQKSLIYIENIKKNKTVTLKLIDSKRPGKGISPLYISKVLNKKLKKNVKKNSYIKINDFR